MGVDLSIWAAVYYRHPLKFTYCGLIKPGQTVREAIKADSHAYEKYFDEYQSSQYEYYLKDDDQKVYYDEYVTQCREDDDEPDSREDWARDQTNFDCENADEEVILPSEEQLLKDYPLKGGWSHAFESGVEFEDVLMVCPGCGHEPVDVNYGAGGGGKVTHSYYCGLCGASMEWEDEQDMYDTMLGVGVVAWPFAPEKREGFYQYCREQQRSPYHPDDRQEYEAWLAKQVVLDGLQ